jgi:DNA primase
MPDHSARAATSRAPGGWRLPPTSSAATSRDELLTIQAEAAAFYRSRLDRSWVPGYLTGRGLDGALEERWNVGHAPAGWTALTRHLTGQGHGQLALLESGLCQRARTGNLIDRFRDRAMLPIRDPGGSIIAFTGRRSSAGTDDRSPKYVNSSATSLYLKSHTVFGLAEASQELARGARAVWVEGALDAVAVTAGTGGRCVGLAACGTAITAQHVEVLARLRSVQTDGLVVALDPDTAGERAAERAHALLSERGIPAVAAQLQDGLDPAALLHERGPAELTTALVERVRPILDMVVDQHLDRWADRLQWVEGRIGAVRDAATVLAKLPRDQARAQVDRVAARVGIDPSVVQREVIQRMSFPGSPMAGVPAARTGPPARGGQPMPTTRAYRR